MATEQELITGGKLILVFFSILAGVLVWYALAFDIQGPGKPTFSSGNLILNILIGLIVSFLYPVLAAGIIVFCEAMEKWAYSAKTDKWPEYSRLFMGAVWPLTLIVCVIVYSFLGIINRVFRLSF